MLASTSALPSELRWTNQIAPNLTLIVPHRQSLPPQSVVLPAKIVNHNQLTQGNLAIASDRRASGLLLPHVDNQIKPLIMYQSRPPPAVFIPPTPSSSASLSSLRMVRGNLQNRLDALKLSIARIFKVTPKADKKALNINRFVEQFKRGSQNAINLYHAIIEAQERRLLVNPTHPFEEKMHEDPNAIVLDMDLMQDRKVKGVVGQIIANFIGDCVGVIISEVFRKSGELAGELARFVVSQAASTILGSGMMAKSDNLMDKSPLRMSKLISKLDIASKNLLTKKETKT